MTNKPFFHNKAIGAFLGAAYGDALGWPNERNHNRSTRNKTTIDSKLKEWIKTSGGRFAPFEEQIRAGEYSDDTQLILAISRSLLKGDNWLHYWQSVELPFWLTYERGGGGATKRAAKSWLNGKAPWEQEQQEKTKYFNAGGNGVAMRILPHIILLREEKHFTPIAERIFLDAITTHGHPRAIIGSLAYGYALWHVSRLDGTLEYGRIIRDMIDSYEKWSSFLIFSNSNRPWVTAATQSLSQYSSVWDNTQKEMLDYLAKALKELEKAALADDELALKQLDMFNKNINGSGTIAAAAAIYLASRYASDPLQGVLKAAFAYGSDTDTIASMTGGLLGLISGRDWLSSHCNAIQDSAYIENLSKQLVDKTFNVSSTQRVDQKSIDLFDEHLAAEVIAKGKQPIILCDGRKGSVRTNPDYVAKSGKYRIQFRQILSEDGQTLYTTKVHRIKSTSTPSVENGGAINCSAVGTKILTHDIRKAYELYTICLGMSVKSKSERLISFTQGLVIIPREYSTFPKMDYHAIVYAEVDNIESAFRRVEDLQLTIISPVKSFGNTGTRQTFSFYDYDNNVVEVFSQESAS